MTGHLSTLPTYNTLLAGDGLCELGPLRISSSMNYASQASTLVLDAPAVHTWPRTSVIWLIIMALEKNIARATNIKQFAAALQAKNLFKW